MPMPSGIENLALGLIQGMNVRKADERQRLQDQRQAEQDQMRRQEFDLQQQARQFDLGNAKTAAANAATDRNRALALQARGDAFNKHFNSAYALAQSGDEEGAVGALATGFNDPAFGLPYKAVPQVGPDGKLVRNKDGKFMIGYADASGKLIETKPWTLGEAMAGFRGINDAAGQFDKLRESQAKASERASEKKDNADAMRLQYDLADRNNSRSAGRKIAGLKTKAALGLAGAGSGGGKAPPDRLSKDGLSQLSSRITQIDDDGNTTVRTVVDTARLGQFQAWAKGKSIPPNDAALQIWLGENPPAPDQGSAAPQETSYDFSELE